MVLLKVFKKSMRVKKPKNMKMQMISLKEKLIRLIKTLGKEKFKLVKKRLEILLKSKEPWSKWEMKMKWKTRKRKEAGDC